MRRMIVSAAAVLLIAALVAATSGYVVILKNGQKIRCRDAMKIDGDQVLITLVTGTLASYPLDQIDVVETERYNKLGFGDAVTIDELTVAGEVFPTATPRSTLGELANIDAFDKNPQLGSSAPPTPTPTPGIQLRSYPYHDARVEQAFTQIFDQKNLYLYRTSSGSNENMFFVQAVTDSEREVFKTLRVVSEAFELIYRLHPEIAPAAVELEMVQTTGKAAGTFRLTPEMVRPLVRGETAVEQFYVDNVIFKR